MSNLNIKFADGNELILYDDYSYHYDGCPTCDYGSSYTNDITIKTTHHTIEIELSQMYSYAFSQADAIRIFAGTDIRNISEAEFLEYIEKEFKQYDCLEKFKVKENGDYL